MKKIFLIIVVLLFLFSGCNSGVKQFEPITGITFTADIAYLAENYKADCTVSKTGDLSAVLRSPGGVNGICVTLSGISSIFEYGGIKIESPVNCLPDVCPISIIHNALSGTGFTDYANNSGNCKLTGKTGEYGYDLLITPSGLPISLEVADIGMKVSFENIKSEQ